MRQSAKTNSAASEDNPPRFFSAPPTLRPRVPRSPPNSESPPPPFTHPAEVAAGELLRIADAEKADRAHPPLHVARHGVSFPAGLAGRFGLFGDEAAKLRAQRLVLVAEIGRGRKGHRRVPLARGDDGGEYLRRPPALLARHVEMGRHAYGARREGGDQHAVLLRPRDDRRRVGRALF